MANISFKNVKKIYFPTTAKELPVTAVADFNLEVEDHDFVVFVGPSGCGKSTTLRMIAGLEDITEGEILINGKIVNDIHPKDRDIAMVFQNYALYAHMTVFDNMAFGLKLRKVPKEEIKERVYAAADILGIREYLDRKPKALSGGQRQRVALGRAIVRDPQVFLMDEPLSNLDAKLRATMRTEISKLHQRLNATIIYVTHDQIEAMTMGTKIVVMSMGLIQQIGTPVEVYQKPANKFVAGFIGTPTMNFFNADIVEEADGLHAKFSGGEILLPEFKSAVLREKGYVGGQVIIGIRPEHMTFIGVGDKVTGEKVVGEFEAHIDVVELLGSETLMYFNIEDNVCAAKAIDMFVDNDQMARFSINAEKVHIFDANTERTITN